MYVCSDFFFRFWVFYDSVMMQQHVNGNEKNLKCLDIGDICSLRDCLQIIGKFDFLLAQNYLTTKLIGWFKIFIFCSAVKTQSHENIY